MSSGNSGIRSLWSRFPIAPAGSLHRLCHQGVSHPLPGVVLLSGGCLMRASSQRWPPLNKTPSLLRGRLPDSQVFAESEGFEPPEAFTSTVFKTAALNHSANSPTYFTFLSERIAKVVKKIYSAKFFLAFRLFFAFSTF